jgi:hypothetical protein
MRFYAISKRLNCSWRDVILSNASHAEGSCCTKVVSTLQHHQTKQTKTALPVSDRLLKNRNDRRIHAREFSVE